MSEYLNKRRQHILDGRPPAPQKKYVIPAVSKKRQKQQQEQKAASPAAGDELKAWYDARRIELTGTCQCGCGQPSQKDNDKYFRGSICHVFPKSIFTSVKTHPVNFIERAVFGGCHNNLDERGMQYWPNMADFEDIKARFFILEKLLTSAEKKHKFYTTLRALIYG